MPKVSSTTCSVNVRSIIDKSPSDRSFIVLPARRQQRVSRGNLIFRLVCSLDLYSPLSSTNSVLHGCSQSLLYATSIKYSTSVTVDRVVSPLRLHLRRVHRAL